MGHTDLPYPFGDQRDTGFVDDEEAEEGSLQEELQDKESREFLRENFDPKELQRILAAIQIQRAFRQHLARGR